MRLICPNCDAQYEVPSDVIPAAGRDLQCSNCSHTWFQHHPDHVPVLAPHPDIADPIPPTPTDSDATSQGDSAEPIDDFEKLLDAELADDPLTGHNTPEPSLRPKRELDPSIASVLREEAEREIRARDAEIMETQGDLGLDDLPSIQPDRPSKPAFFDPDLDELNDLYSQGANDPDFHRRDLLPDIEEINSSLRGTDAKSTSHLSAQNGKSKSGRSGFIFAIILIAFAVWVYLNGETMVSQFPNLAQPISDYVAMIDHARMTLDQWVSDALTWLDVQAAAARGN